MSAILKLCSHYDLPHNFAKAIKSDLPNTDKEALSLDDLLVDSDYGVEAFRGNDPWVVIESLGLVGLQPPNQVKLVKSTTKDQAHLRRLDDTGNPIKGEDGEWIWENPEVHDAKIKVKFPGINWLDSKPLDRNEWDTVITSTGVQRTVPPLSAPSRRMHQSTHPCTSSWVSPILRLDATLIAIADDELPPW